MPRQLRAPTPDFTCGFKKGDGSACKIRVGKGERYCWYHSRGLRRRWRSLTRNQTVIFLITLLSLIIGIPSFVGFMRAVLRHYESSEQISPPTTVTAVEERPLPNPFGEGDIGILVAEVPGDKNREEQQKYVNAIREQVQKSPDLADVVKVHMLERPLAADPEQQHEEAIELGRKLHAAFVLRPFVIQGLQEPWLTIVDESGFSKTEARMEKFKHDQFAELETLALPRDLLLLARCIVPLSLAKRGLYDKAAKELKVVLHLLPLASASVRGVAPPLVGMEWDLGSYLTETGDLTGAAQAYQKALRLEPSLAPLRNNLALVWKDQGKTDAAIGEFRIAIETSPNEWTYHSNLGNALLRKGDIDAAISEEEAAVRLKPDSDFAHSNLGIALEQRGEPAQAVAEHEKAVALNPSDWINLQNLGEAYCRIGRSDKAVPVLARAAKIAPRVAVVHAQFGSALCERGNPESGIEEVREAISLGPDIADLHITLANCLAFNQDYKGAISELKKGLSMPQNNRKLALRAYVGLCGYLPQVGQFIEALKNCRKAVRLDPKSAVAYNNLGSVLIQQERCKEAVQALEKAIALDPQLSQAHTLLNRARLCQRR